MTAKLLKKSGQVFKQELQITISPIRSTVYISPSRELMISKQRKIFFSRTDL